MQMKCFIKRATSLKGQFSPEVFDNIWRILIFFALLLVLETKQCGCEFCEFREESEQTIDSSCINARMSPTPMENTLKPMFDSP